MFHLPLEIIHFILEFLSYQELILLEKAFPQKEEFIHTIKLKKGRIILSNLNDEIEKMRGKYTKQEGAELCQAQPAKHKLFGSNGAIFLV